MHEHTMLPRNIILNPFPKRCYISALRFRLFEDAQFYILTIYPIPKTLHVVTLPTSTRDKTGTHRIEDDSKASLSSTWISVETIMKAGTSCKIRMKYIFSCPNFYSTLLSSILFSTTYSAGYSSVYTAA